MFLIFLECVKITAVGLKLDRPQLQYWLLFLEHNWPTPKSENSNVVGLPQLQYWLLFLEHNWPTPKSENSNVVGLLWAMTVLVLQLVSPPVLLIFSDAGSSSSFSRIQQVPALVDLRAS